LALIDHRAGQSWLIDATPDFREQINALGKLAPNSSLAGIVLSHAHMGHYLGLVYLGYEAWNTQALPVYASPSMSQFLSTHAPWSQLIVKGNVQLHTLVPNQEITLAPGLYLAPIPVPHRDEFSDTMAFVVRGSSRRLFYCPDIDGWQQWDQDLQQFVSNMDVALLDGTFFAPDELSGRDQSQIPHPLVTDTASRLTGVLCDVRIIHMNHSNPLHRPGEERNWLEQQGIGVGQFGDRWRLDA
jgi:pyrroloquinoline quinone biosynthesis protein B